ncbi:MAG: hypothetical protein QM820_04190 [Minicystis sp.]
MNRLAWLVLSLAAASCTPPAPPAQVVEPLPPVPEAPSGTPTAGPLSADMPGADGKAVEAPVGPPAEAFQPVSGTLGGKPWELKGAGTLGPVQKDGNVLVALANYPIDCGQRDATPEDRTITLLIPWKARTRLDLGALGAKEASATAIDEKKKKPVPIKGFKPKGTVDVLAAPTRMKSSGRIKIDLTSGKEDAIKAEVPVRLCFTD